jgi:hypothetical protein
MNVIKTLSVKAAIARIMHVLRNNLSDKLELYEGRWLGGLFDLTANSNNL